MALCMRWYYLMDVDVMRSSVTVLCSDDRTGVGRFLYFVIVWCMGRDGEEGIKIREMEFWNFLLVIGFFNLH